MDLIEILTNMIVIKNLYKKYIWHVLQKLESLTGGK